MDSASQIQPSLNMPLILAGFKHLVPISLFVAVFGAAFGLAALQSGLSETDTVIMSTLVFAGASQFAALDLWGTQVSLIPLILTVFAINARHLLMGATLYPWLKQLPPAKRYATMVVASDANWALSMQAFNKDKPGLGLLFGGGLALWSFWIVGTWVGVYFGNFISNPEAFGLDMVMGCFLLAMVVSGEKNTGVLIIWCVAALSSALAWYYLPENSRIIVGTLAGGIAGVVIGGKEHAH